MCSHCTSVAYFSPMDMLLCTLHCHTEIDYTATFEVLSAVLLKAQSLWDVMLCRLERKLPKD
jgi:hypothetical protein